jgi:hypothetical protein
VKSNFSKAIQDGDVGRVEEPIERGVQLLWFLNIARLVPAKS